MRRKALIAVCLMPLLACAAATNPPPSAATPAVPATADIAAPPIARELRAAWIPTVANIAWPSKPGLSVADQKRELLSLLDHAAQLHLNAVFLQVRSVCDAIYPSALEPWSEYITGTQGRAPEPFYDPLELAVAEAHRRGLQLHAWFNPFRAGHPEAKSPPALSHVTSTHPELIRHYARQTWCDPGEPDSQARALAAVLDVVKRYDVDGVVFDDYFYPYPEKNGNGQPMDFPDGATWKRFGAQSGLGRDDWRRDNINQFVRKVAQAVHGAKPWVQFGISPFGIWRPGVPAGIDAKALDAYAKLFADARFWLASGWVDYLAPQLYWPTFQREHGFTALFQWWRQQNPKGRRVYAALNDAGVGAKFSADEIGRQIDAVRTITSNGGEVHYHLRNLVENADLAKIVAARYAQPALPPVMPWLATNLPSAPKLTVNESSRSHYTRLSMSWENTGKPVGSWLLQVCKPDGDWTTEILPAGQTSRTLENFPAKAILLRAVDRAGNLSDPAVWVPRKDSPSDTAFDAKKMKH